MPELSLMQLSEREQAWLEALTHDDEEGNPISEEIQDKVISEYIAADGDFKAKVDRYCDLIAAFSGRAAYQEHMADHYRKMQQRNQGVADKMRMRLKQVMELRGETKIETNDHRLSLVKNGGRARVIVPDGWIYDPAKAPERFHHHKIQLDSNAIRAALEDGETIEGCAIADRGTHLRIL